MNRLVITLFCIAFGLCSACKPRGDDAAYEQRRVSFLHDCFPTNQEAIVLGDKIIASLATGTKIAQEEWWGEKVAFYGSGPAIGGMANLGLAPNILLLVEIQPSANVAPTAAVWEACVLGKFLSVDFDKKIISITATPEDWHSGETM